MYGCGVLMGLINIIFNNTFEKPYHHININIFVTLFMIGVVVWLIEYRRENKIKGEKIILIFAVIQVVTTVICELIVTYIPLYGMKMFIGAITGNLIFNEGSIIFVFLGVLMYFNKESKKDIGRAYGIFCVIYFVITAVDGFTIEMLFNQNYQWMMIAALPFMVLYNGQKGKGLKYLFYGFYPVHIVVLFLIGNLCF
jgi:hypothetical protein